MTRPTVDIANIPNRSAALLPRPSASAKPEDP